MILNCLDAIIDDLSVPFRRFECLVSISVNQNSFERISRCAQSFPVNFSNQVEQKAPATLNDIKQHPPKIHLML